MGVISVALGPDGRTTSRSACTNTKSPRAICSSQRYSSRVDARKCWQWAHGAVHGHATRKQSHTFHSGWPMPWRLLCVVCVGTRWSPRSKDNIAQHVPKIAANQRVDEAREAVAEWRQTDGVDEPGSTEHAAVVHQGAVGLVGARCQQLAVPMKKKAFVSRSSIDRQASERTYVQHGQQTKHQTAKQASVGTSQHPRVSLHGMVHESTYSSSSHR